MRTSRVTKLIAGLTFFLLLISLSSAHLEGGEDATVDGYIIDFGHSPEEPVAGERANFLLNFVNATTEQPVSADKAWVRISKGNHIVFSGNLAPERGSFTFSQVLPEGGEYTVDTRFIKDGKKLAEHAFHLEVEGNTGDSKIIIWIQTALLLLLAAGLAYAGFRLRTGRNV